MSPPGLDPALPPPLGVRHARVVGALAAAIRARSAGRPWRLVENGASLRLDDAPFRPDVMLIAAPPPGAGTPLELTDALLVADVQAPGRDDDDFRRTLLHYRLAPSLRAYLLFSQWEPKVLVHVQQGAGWFLETLTGVESVIHLPGVGLSLPLIDIYS